jgi:hypothetical protein
LSVFCFAISLRFRIRYIHLSWEPLSQAGEMKKLGHKLCPSTVKNILKKHGIPPVPFRKGMSWKKFISFYRLNLYELWLCAQMSFCTVHLLQVISANSLTSGITIDTICS